MLIDITFHDNANGGGMYADPGLSSAHAMLISTAMAQIV
jgi:hypothetical protein